MTNDGQNRTSPKIAEVITLNRKTKWNCN